MSYLRDLFDRVPADASDLAVESSCHVLKIQFSRSERKKGKKKNFYSFGQVLLLCRWFHRPFVYLCGCLFRISIGRPLFEKPPPHWASGRQVELPMECTFLSLSRPHTWTGVNCHLDHCTCHAREADSIYPFIVCEQCRPVTFLYYVQNPFLDPKKKKLIKKKTQKN